MDRIQRAAETLYRGGSVVIAQEDLLPRIGTNLALLQRDLAAALNALEHDPVNVAVCQWSVSIFPIRDRPGFYRARAKSKLISC